MDVALLNFESGGLEKQSRGVWDFNRLARLLAPTVDQPPHILALMEAKEYGLWGQIGLFGAANTLSRLYRRPYEGRLGFIPRGLYGPALFYDTSRVRIDVWGDAHETVPDDQRNMARAHLVGSDQPLRIVLAHWDYDDGNSRLRQAKAISRYGLDSMPTLIAGDLNSTASRPELDTRDWNEAPIRVRQRTGWQPDGPDGAWRADTRAIDHLIGDWRPAESRRDAGSGFSAVCEIARNTGTSAYEAFRPTINNGEDAGGGIVVDWLLVNQAWQKVFPFKPGSYHVHVPALSDGEHWDSDHRLVTASFQ